MKISCPVCGQHFEVEANILERYFRCTECKTLFCGLNAKVVKERKFRRKSEAMEDEIDEITGLEDAVEENTGDTSAAITVEAGAVPADAVELQKADESYWNDVLESDARDRERDAGIFRLKFDMLKWLPVACLVLLLITFILALVTKSKVDDLIAGYEEFSSRSTLFSTRLDLVEQQNGKTAQQLHQLKSNVEKLTGVCEHINSKLNEQVAAGKAFNPEKTSGEIQQLYKELAECRKKLAELEADMRKSIAGQKASQ